MVAEQNDNYRDAAFLELMADEIGRYLPPRTIAQDDPNRMRRIADRLRKEGYGHGNPAQHSGK